MERTDKQFTSVHGYFYDYYDTIKEKTIYDSIVQEFIDEQVFYLANSKFFEAKDDQKIEQWKQLLVRELNTIESRLEEETMINRDFEHEDLFAQSLANKIENN